MMRTFLPLLLVAVALGGCAIVVTPGDAHFAGVFDSGTAGNGQIVNEVRPVLAANAIDVSGPLDVQVQVGAAPRLEVEGDANLLPMIRTELHDGVLRIWLAGSVSRSARLRVVYATPALHRIARSGSGQLQVTGLSGRALQVSASGSGGTRLQGAVGRLDVQSGGSGTIDASALALGGADAQLRGSGALWLGRLEGGELLAEVHGSGSLGASGVVQHLRGTIYSSGSLQLAGLSAERAELASHGSGAINVAVTGELDAQTTSSGSINVRGNPPVRQSSGRNVHVNG